MKNRVSQVICRAELKFMTGNPGHLENLGKNGLNFGGYGAIPSLLTLTPFQI